MATITKTKLSASTDGLGVKVAATATPGTTIHTGSATATTYEEVWLYAVNSDTTARKLTIEWGGVTSPDCLIELTIAPEDGLTLVIPGLLLKGNATPKVITAFCGTANVVMIHGYVNSIAA